MANTLSSSGRSMLDTIAARTSVRKYTKEAVPSEMVEQLLRAAMAAPSAMNGQPWEFIVVDDRATLDTLADRLRYAKMLFGAPLAITVCARPYFIDKEGVKRDGKFWAHDAGAATENILIAAQAMGLGTCWTAAADDRAEVVREVLGVPSDVNPFAVIAVGWPDGDFAPKDKWNTDKIHNNRW